MEKFLETPSPCLKFRYWPTVPGGAIHLVSVNCSMQRVTKKWVDRGSSTWITPEVRAKLARDLPELCVEIGYRGAAELLKFLYE